MAQYGEFAQPVKNYHLIFAADDGHGIAKAGIFDVNIWFYATVHLRYPFGKY